MKYSERNLAPVNNEPLRGRIANECAYLSTNAVIVPIALALTASATYSPLNTPSGEAAGKGGYRLSKAPLCEGNSDSLFVVLAFSGGVLRNNFQTRVVKRKCAPANLARLPSRRYGRTDIWAGFFAGAALPDESIQIDAQQVVVKKFVIVLVNAKQPNNSNYNATSKADNLFKILAAADELPISHFSSFETAYRRTYIRTLTERQRIREHVAQISGEQGIAGPLPALDVPDTHYYFVEVAFDSLSDDRKKAYLNGIPTAFRLNESRQKESGAQQEQSSTGIRNFRGYGRHSNETKHEPPYKQEAIVRVRQGAAVVPGAYR